MAAQRLRRRPPSLAAAARGRPRVAAAALCLALALAGSGVAAALGRHAGFLRLAASPSQARLAPDPGRRSAAAAAAAESWRCAGAPFAPLAPPRRQGLGSAWSGVARRAGDAGAVEEASEAELEAAVRAGGAVVLDVYAVWCGPCKLMEPVLDALAERLGTCGGAPEAPKPRVLRMDADRYPNKASALRVEGLPSVIFFNGGKETGRVEGVVTTGDLEAAASTALGIEALATPSATNTPLEFLSSMEELELAVQMEEALVLVVLPADTDDATAFASSLEALQKMLRVQPPPRVLAAEALPEVAQYLGVGDLPALVLYERGERLTHLQGPSLAAMKPGEIAAVVNVAFTPA